MSIKINYGIDLGTTNSAISRFENGEVIIKKSLDNQKDTTPSCINYNNKGAIFVGDKAFQTYKSESLKNLKSNKSLNSFVEFKRTMGSDHKYFSTNTNHNYSSEQLSAEVLKRLKEYIDDDQVNAAVITIPAAFTSNQVEATRRAAHLAGINHVEMLQEPVAAAMAYGVKNKKDGFWLVFDFGGGTFDAALIKVEDGIIKVIDTKGDNFLGGKDLDLAIVNQSIIPHIKENFEIDELEQSKDFKNALKFFAEEIKNNLTFNETYSLYVDPGDAGEDDNGEEIEIDLQLNQNELETIIKPHFQKAINIVKELLADNNIANHQLESLILVGGPTLSPILREMLAEQIITPDTSVDPMTVVSVGASIYASTLDLNEEVKDLKRDATKLQLDLGYEASSVELEEFVRIKIDTNKTVGDIPNKVFAQFANINGTWNSEKIEINGTGEIIDVPLKESATNTFSIKLVDEYSNPIECQPSEFSIIQGSKIGSMTLPYSYGIEVFFGDVEKELFSTIQGLEKNQSLPAIGVKNKLKTPTDLRPGMASDKIIIPIYQGEKAEKSRAIYNEHVFDIVITGEDLPALVPANTEVDLTISVDSSQNIKVEVYFHYLDHTHEVEVPAKQSKANNQDNLVYEIKKAKKSAQSLNNHGLIQEIQEIEKDFDLNKNDAGGQLKVLNNLRTTLKKIDQLSEGQEWPQLKAELEAEFDRLDKANTELGNSQTNTIFNEIKIEMDQVIRAEDLKLGKVLLDKIERFYFELTKIYQIINLIREYDSNYHSYPWRDANRARTLINQGLQTIGSNPSEQALLPILIGLFDLLPEEVQPEMGGSNRLRI